LCLLHCIISTTDCIVINTLSYPVKPRVGFGAQVWYHCRIIPPRFLAECRKRRLNQGSFVVLYFNFSALSDLYLVFACLFFCTVFVFSYCMFIFLYCFVCQYILTNNIGQVIGCEDRLRNDLYCVGWGVKLCSTSTSCQAYSPTKCS